MSKSAIRTAASRRTSAQPARFNSADGAVDIRAWAQMLVERGNQLFERAERERVALIGTRESSPRAGSTSDAATRRARTGESRRLRGKDVAPGAKPR